MKAIEFSPGTVASRPPSHSDGTRGSRVTDRVKLA